MVEPIIHSVVKNSVQIQSEIVPYIIDLTYEDIFKAGVSNFNIRIAPYSNRPVLGDFMEIRFKYSGITGEKNTGTHRIDDISYRFGEDTIDIGAVSWDYQLGLKEVGKGTYSNSNLSNIVSNIASNYGLTISGVVSNNKAGTSSTTTGLVSETFENESQIDFLNRLANKYGYAFNLKFGLLIFQSIETLRSASSIATVTPSDIIIGARFRESVYNTFRKIRVRHKNGTIILTDSSVPGNDELDLTDEGYYENYSSAVMRAKGAAYEANTKRITGEISLYGEPIYNPGNNITISGLGSPIDGVFIIEKVRNTITKNGGWISFLNISAVFTNHFSVSSV